MKTVQRLYQYFKPSHYNLSIALDQDKRVFTGTVTVDGTRNIEYSSIKLHSKDLVISSVSVNGKQSTYQLDATNDELTITPSEQNESDIIVTVSFSGILSETMHGIYISKYSHNNSDLELIVTQFESHHAREAFPCIDEPEAKATYDVTLTTKLKQTVLSNMPVLLQREENKQLVTTFETTPLMSTYLLAFVIGDLHKQTSLTSAGVEVNVWATPAQPAESLGFALKHAIQTIEFFDDYFGIPYPLPKSDHVALPDFGSGAMENWGLVTYRETALLADPTTTTVANKQYIATVISHELSHMWFGNLVTMKWWNDLWLNESFATLMEYVAVDAIHPEWNIWLDFAANESVAALRRDAMSGVQSVRVDVNHPDEISALFDGAIVYAKGARLLGMLRAYVGNEVFRKGLQEYFKKYSYQNTEADNLWEELSLASGKDIAAFMNPWLTKPGYPVVSVTNGSVSQQRFFIGPHDIDESLWPIPLGLSSGEDVLFSGSLDDLALPDSIYLNHGNSAHFITRYEPEHLASLCQHITSKQLPAITRLSLLSEQLLLARSGDISTSQLVPMIGHYREEDNDVVWDTIARTIGELKQFVENDLEAEHALKKLSFTIAKERYKSLGWSEVSSESESDKKLRETILSLVTYSDDSVVISEIDHRYASSSIAGLDPETRPLILGSIVKRTKELDIVKELFDLYVSSPSADLRSDIQSGLTAVRQSEQIEYVLSQLTNTSVIRPQDIATWFIHMIRNRYARDVTWEWMKNNWQWIEEKFSGDKSYDYFPRYAAAGLVSKSQLDEYIAFFSPLRNEPSLTRTIDVGIVEVQARVDLLARDTAPVCETLHNL